MSFSINLNKLISVIGCNNVQLSNVSNIDSSLISRYRNGLRTPVKNSSTFQKLINGIVKLIDLNNCENSIRNLFGENNTQEDLIDIIPNWLYTFSSNKSINLPFYGDRIGNIMRLLNITNVRLARYLNVDPSLISKYKNNLRNPNSNNLNSHKICNFFARIAISQNQYVEIMQFIEYSSDIESIEALEHGLYHYIFEHKENPNKELIHNFLININSLDFNYKNYLESQLAVHENTQDNEYLFYGLDGQKKAIIKFLLDSMSDSTPSDLLIYTDQNVEDLINCLDFSQTWTYFISEFILKNISVKLIHNINNNIKQTLEIITKWLPLYLTGVVIPYYCRKSIESRFCHTIFLNKDKNGLVSSSLKGCEKNSVFHYFSDAKACSFYEAQYNELLKMSSPLISYIECNMSDEYTSQIRHLSNSKGDTNLLLPSLSICTIPEHVFEKILHYNDVDENEVKTIMEKYLEIKSLFFTALNNGELREYAAIPHCEEPNDKIVLNLKYINYDKKLYYRASDFFEQVLNICSILNKYPNYFLYPLEKPLFENIQILSKKNTTTIISKVDYPISSFYFNNIDIINCFDSYITSNKNHCIYTDKKDVIKHLKNIVNII